MTRLITFTLAALMLTCLALAEPPKPKPVIVCVSDGQRIVATVTVIGPDKTPGPPDEKTQQDIRNVLKGFGHHGKVTYRVGDPSPEPSRPSQKREPQWDPPADPSYDCTCATATFDQHKRLAGCVADGCDGCWICVRR